VVNAEVLYSTSKTKPLKPILCHALSQVYSFCKIKRNIHIYVFHGFRYKIGTQPSTTRKNVIRPYHDKNITQGFSALLILLPFI
jgi:hypothetical protein